MPEIKEAGLPNMLNNAVLLIVTSKGIGNSRSVAPGMFETGDADPRLFKMSKTLLDSPQLRAINAHFSAMKRYLQTRALKAPFKSGSYAVPIDRIEEVDIKVETFQAELPMLVEDFLQVYDIQRDRAKSDLKEHWSADDYLTLEQLRTAFSITWEYYSVEVPDALNQVSPQIYKRQREQLAAKLREAEEEIVYTVRGMAMELMDKLVQLLTDDGDGSKKVIKENQLQKVRNFVEEFSVLDIAEDGELQPVVNQIGALLEGVDCKELRTNEGFRTEMRERFTQVQETLSGMMTNAPRRAMNLEDDDWDG